MVDQTLSPEQIGPLNERLTEISRAVYGEKAVFRIVDPKSLTLLKKNAHFMKKPVFDQLAANVRQDGMLASTALCHELPDFSLEVLSGNHRVQAAIKAELAWIVVLVIPHQTQEQKIAVQLSHNALVGQDDKAILAELWKEMGDIQSKLYSGLDSALVAELEKIKFTGFTAQQVRTEQIALWFLPEEVEALEELLGEATKIVAAGEVYLAPLAKYKAMFDALVKTKRTNNIKNTAVAFGYLIDRLAEILAADAKAAEQTDDKSCAGSSDGAAPVDQTGEGGSNPSPALSGV